MRRSHLAVIFAVAALAPLQSSADSSSAATRALRALRPINRTQNNVGPTGIKVSIPLKRRAMLRAVATRLQAAGVDAYGTFFKGKGKHGQGAMLVASVPSNTARKKGWIKQVGQHSIGFQTDLASDDTGSSSGHVRVGNEGFTYSWVRGGGKSSYSKPTDVRQSNPAGSTEVTFMVSKSELKAFRGFFYARSLSLVKLRNGVTEPTFEAFGKDGMRTEGCAQAASSPLNPVWINAFARHFNDIKAHGEANNIQAIKDMPANAPALLKKFIARTGARQQADPRGLVRLNSPNATMITVFQDHRGDAINGVKWDRSVKYYVKPASSRNAGQRVFDRDHMSWRGMGAPWTIMDNPNSSPAETFKSKRMGLSEFAGSL